MKTDDKIDISAVDDHDGILTIRAGRRAPGLERHSL
jgi:hypothetical protein